MVHDKKERSQGGTVFGEGRKQVVYYKEKDTSRSHSAWWVKQVVNDKRERRQESTVLGEGSRWNMTTERNIKEAQ